MEFTGNRRTIVARTDTGTVQPMDTHTDRQTTRQTDKAIDEQLDRMINREAHAGSCGKHRVA